MSYGKESGGERRRGLRRTAEPECQKRMVEGEGGGVVG